MSPFYYQLLIVLQVIHYFLLCQAYRKLVLGPP